ncbi:Splicing factor U2AF 26 kDa subunit [Geranomyces variabilis]|nr:Splicing factor U2AF 26 kDa subunit [Geranomyces variabilis]
MADHLASIYGTEKDKVNCSFYFKIGACRHGDRCSRKHVKPSFSQTVLLSNVYQNPAHEATCSMTETELQDHFDLFWEDIYVELAKYGEIEEMNVCDNVGDHLVGNVYVRYKYEEDAGNAVTALNERFYAGRPLYAELSPVTDFGEACCRQYEMAECTRGGFCNFMHLKLVSRSLEKELFAAQKETLAMKKKEKRDAERAARASAGGGGSDDDGGGRDGRERKSSSSRRHRSRTRSPDDRRRSDRSDSRRRDRDAGYSSKAKYEEPW